MGLFLEWLSLKLEAAKKKAAPHPLKPISVRHKQIQTTPVSPSAASPKKKRRKTKKPKKPRPSPSVSTDVDRWLNSVALLSKDIQDFKKAQEKYKQKQIAIDKKRKETESKIKRADEVGKAKPNKAAPVAKSSKSTPSEVSDGERTPARVPTKLAQQRRTEPSREKSKKPEARKVQRKKVRVNEGVKHSHHFISFSSWIEDVEKA